MTSWSIRTDQTNGDKVAEALYVDIATEKRCDLIDSTRLAGGPYLYPISPNGS